MSTVDFVYDYPYVGFDKKGRFCAQVSNSRVKLNGCYTYPMVFNNKVPGCRHIKIAVRVINTGSGSVFKRSWDFMVCKSNGTWINAEKFYMPVTGEYTVDCDINGLDITMFTLVPSSDPGASQTWDTYYTFEQLRLTETVELKDVETGMFVHGIFPYNYGVIETPAEVHVNIGGALVRATDVLVNVNGVLKSVPPVYSAYFTSETETMFVCRFIPETSGTYRITQKDISGDHEIRFYSSDFTMLYDGYFYDQSFELTAGTIYYISVTHYINEEEAGKSYLQIYKEV